MAKTAAIVGGGVIGGAWAARFLLHGWDVVVADPADGAEARIAEVLTAARYALPMLYDVALPAAGRLRVVPGIAEAVAAADWIQESVPERLEIKHAVYAQIEAAAPADALIGSSTSGFKPSELREGMAHPDRLLVVHPFVPVYLLPLVELVAGPAPDDAVVSRAEDVLREIGMHPLRVRGEIDAHIADRLMEAVWREGLWLVKDGIATTEEIDDAIRYGFGLRWAQMGLFETFRIGGGPKGMRHFLHQFGPALKWPWTKLMDVPDLDDELVDLIAGQSDAQSGHLSIAELERLRDDNLIVMMRALKARGTAVGAVLTDQEERLRRPLVDLVPLITVERTVPADWTDYNGHMNEGRYGQVFSDAADAVMVHIGADAAYIAAGNSYFTAETTIRYLDECTAGTAVRVRSRVTQGEGKKLRLWHEMLRAEDDHLLATCDQFLLHVSLETRRSCPPLPEVEERLTALARAHFSETH